MLSQKEAQSLHTLSQLRGVQAEFERSQKQFEERLEEVKIAKDREAAAALSSVHEHLSKTEERLQESEKVWLRS